MADTIREQIIQAIITGLGSVTTANGYNTNCGGTVLRAVSSVDPDELPVFVVWPQPEESERKYGESNNAMVIRIEGFMLLSGENPSVVSELILGDMIKAMTGIIGGENGAARMTDDLADDVAYISGGPSAYPDDGGDSMGSSAEFQIKYCTAIGNPYSQS